MAFDPPTRRRRGPFFDSRRFKVPDISLKLSDFRVPALVIAALITGLLLGGGPSSETRRAEMAQPLHHLSLTPAKSFGPETSLRPRARPNAIGLAVDLPVSRSGEAICLEHGYRLNGAPIAYLSQVCLWYESINTDVFPKTCETRVPGVDGGRMIYTVGCLVREGYWRRAEAAQ